MNAAAHLFLWRRSVIGISLGGGDEILTQLLIGRVQTHRQGELSSAESFNGQLSKLRQSFWHANGAHRDPALADAQIITEATDRFQDGTAVEQRFTHPHEHDVRGTAIHHLPHTENLINDLVGSQGTLQPIFAGGAETAGHRTAHLTGHTESKTLIRGNAHRFDGFTVIGGQQQLGGGIGCH